MSEENQQPPENKPGWQRAPLDPRIFLAKMTLPDGTKRVSVVIHPCQILKDMRHVWREPAEMDKTPGQKMLRRILEEDPKRFFTECTKLDKAHLQARTSVRALQAQIRADRYNSEQEKISLAKAGKTNGKPTDRALETVNRLLGLDANSDLEGEPNEN